MDIEVQSNYLNQKSAVVTKSITYSFAHKIDLNPKSALIRSKNKKHLLEIKTPRNRKSEVDN